MKRNLYIFTLVATLLFAACNDTDRALAPVDVSQPLSIGATMQQLILSPLTRTVPGTDEFLPEDCIGVSIATSTTVPTDIDANHPYRYNGTSWDAIGNPIYWHDATTTHTLRAYYPYDEVAYAAAATTHRYPLPVAASGAIDLSTPSAYAAADHAWGMLETTPTDAPLSIPMTHLMSQVIFTLTPGAAVTQAEVEDMDCHLLASPGTTFPVAYTFDILRGRLAASATPSSSAIRLLPCRAIDGSPTFYALVLPGQVFGAGQPFAAIIDSHGSTYTYLLRLKDAPDANLTTEVGQIYRFDLVVSRQQVSGMGVTSNVWGDPQVVAPTQDNDVEVINSTVGGLSTLLNATTATQLMITGEVNDTDMGALKSYIQSQNVTDLYLNAKGTETIGLLAFADCSSLTSVSLPAAETIGAGAFFGCSSLTSVSLPMATMIGDQAFFTCSSLTSVSLPAAETIGGFAFFGCSSLTSVSLPMATMIGDQAFFTCSSLTSVSLPAAETIKIGAFADCSSLRSLVIAGAAGSTIGADAFFRVSVPVLYLVNASYSDVEVLGREWGAWGGYSWPAVHSNYRGVGAMDAPASYGMHWTR